MKNRELSLLGRIGMTLTASLAAAIDTALLYAVVDYLGGYTMEWGLIVIIWWIMEVVHNLDLISDYKNGLI